MNTSKYPDLEEFKKILRKNSLKATPQRLAVHEAMMALGHASADMVTEEILSQGKAKVTVASVYNILTQLASLGIYHHRMSTNNKMYFDVNTFYHAHFYDRENHTFKDVLDEDLAAMIKSHLGRKKFKGYKVESIDIQIIGRPSRKKYVI
jgi:Fe2+ or Zn2+ uptake regulation protein